MGDELCSLECLNGGVCQFVYSEQDRPAAVRSGHLVQQCECPEGFGGLGCELKVEGCSRGFCSHGISCSVSSWRGEEPTCDCAWADRVDGVAGMLCRNTFTEYCNGGKYSSEEALTFCTNGGKCRSSYLAARIGPDHPSIVESFEHLGCVCNPNFYGPHCEYLKYTGQGPYLPGLATADEDPQPLEDEPVRPFEEGPPRDIFEPPPERIPDVNNANIRSERSSLASERDVLNYIVPAVALVVVLGTLAIILTIRRHRQRRRQRDWMKHLAPEHPNLMAGYGRETTI